jgi:hypothetical protein
VKQPNWKNQTRTPLRKYPCWTSRESIHIAHKEYPQIGLNQYSAVAYFVRESTLDVIAETALASSGCNAMFAEANKPPDFVEKSPKARTRVRELLSPPRPGTSPPSL